MKQLLRTIVLMAAIGLYTNMQAQNDVVTAVGASMYMLPKGKAYGVNYHYRNNFRQIGDGNSLSFSVNPALALHYDAVLKSQLVLDCPVLFSYNLGYSSTSSNNRDLGLFLGTGMGAHFLQGSGLGVGPEFAIGFRGKVANAPMELKINFHYDLFVMSSDLLSLHLNILLNQRN